MKDWLAINCKKMSYSTHTVNDICEIIKTVQTDDSKGFITEGPFWYSSMPVHS